MAVTKTGVEAGVLGDNAGTSAASSGMLGDADLADTRGGTGSETSIRSPGSSSSGVDAGFGAGFGLKC